MRLFFSGLVLGMVMTGFVSSAQTALRADADSVKKVQPKVIVKRPKPLRAELSVGFRLNTNGWSVFADRGWVRDNGNKESDLFYNLRYAQIEFSEVKHPKEIKHTNTALSAYTNDKPKPYIFGKINNFYTLKLGYGLRKMIAGKPEYKTVSVHWFTAGGLSLGMLKPYYINAYVPQDNGSGALSLQTIKYTDSTKGSFLTDQLIIGSAGFSEGLGEISFVPGLQLKTGLHFDFAAWKKTVMAIEVGASGELYSKKIEILANQAAVPYNFNVFASFQFGKRW